MLSCIKFFQSLTPFKSSFSYFTTEIFYFHTILEKDCAYHGLQESWVKLQFQCFMISFHTFLSSIKYHISIFMNNINFPSERD